MRDTRLRAVCDLSVSAARQDAGLHDYDGVVQDLSPAGVAADLRALGSATPDLYPDPYDEALAIAAEGALRVRFGELELHRVNPLCTSRTSAWPAMTAHTLRRTSAEKRD